MGTSNDAKLPEGAQKRWAIQVATTDLGEERGLGVIHDVTNQKIEHSFTRLAQIWCDADGNPLLNEDGTPMSPIQVRGEIHGGAIDNETGLWGAAEVNISTVGQAMDRAADGIVGAFNKSSLADNPSLSKGVAYLENVWEKISGRVIDWVNGFVYGDDSKNGQPSKLGIKSAYGNFDATDPDSVEILIMSDNLEPMETTWAGFQDKALQIEAQGLDYDLSGTNCHTVTSEILGDMTDFLRGTTLRFGADPEAIETTSNPALVAGLSLEEIQERNRDMANEINGNHYNNATNQTVEQAPKVATSENTAELAFI